MTKDVRVRFAPSPTGALHIGNIRAAVFNWLFSKKEDGRLVLRMEDTDTARSTKEAEAAILADLKWLGIDFDEGPVQGGDYAPYRQSERTPIYAEHLNRLLEEKKAYRCYCSKEDLDEVRREQVRRSEMPSYTGKCRDLAHLEIEQFEKEGRKPVVRLLISDKTVTFDDLVKGEITYDTGSLGGDLIIRRSDSSFVYNFTVVVDDALMKISHVIRGEDHLTNTVKQILLYEALGFALPEFAHMPLILGGDKKKLSKRALEESFDEFKKAGILPGALVNYTALLGWSSKDGTEIFSSDELTTRFDLKNVSKSPSVFSYDKLKWVSSKHVKMMSDEDFAQTLFDFLKYYHHDYFEKQLNISIDDIDKEKFIEFTRLIKESVDILNDALDYLKMFFGSKTILSQEAEKALKQNSAVAVVRAFLENLKREPVLDRQSYQNIMKDIKESLDVKGKALFMPIRAAVSGNTGGPHLDDICAFLTKDVVIERIEKVLAYLNGNPE